MKHFTRLALSLSFLLWAAYSMAQYDLQVLSTATVSTSGGQVPPGIPISLSIEIKNSGADWPVGTQLAVGAITSSGDTFGITLYTVQPPNPFAAGSTAIVST